MAGQRSTSPARTYSLQVGQPFNPFGLFNGIWIPEVIDELAGIPATVATQLLAYYIARKRGADIDKPRNLAKSVTVE